MSKKELYEAIFMLVVNYGRNSLHGSVETHKVTEDIIEKFDLYVDDIFEHIRPGTRSCAGTRT